MCGICGYTRVRATISPAFIESMKTDLAHRGPDAHGTWSDENMVLGHRRLSIIDVNAGHQPMLNEDGTIVTICNGEIYNYRQLRERLETCGHRFKTRSDTEILVHLYESCGEEMVDHLVGMFAFVIWDSRTRVLLMARDRYGQKPVYYAQRNGQLIFSSGLKSLARHPDVSGTIDYSALSKYLAFEYIPAPLSIYRNVFKLDAGSMLIWRNGDIRIRRYWTYPLGGNRYRGGFADAADELARRLSDGVKSQLVSDVPLGVFLSGGIDSSLIVAMMAQHMPADQIQTFSIGFREPSFDESHHARRIATHFGTRHRQDVLDVAKLSRLLPDVVAVFDEPFADASAIPTYLLSRFAGRHVTVALGGDGGDELFAGYDPFVAHRIAGWLLKCPDGLRQFFVDHLINRLPVSDRNMSFEFRIKRFFKYLCREPVLRNHLWLGSFNHPMQNLLWTPDFNRDRQDPFSSVYTPEKPERKTDDLDRIAGDFIRTYLQEGILTKVDRASMAHGLEVRAPFLDHELGEFVASLPMKWKLKGLTTKFILKFVAGRYLPHGIVNRRKKGFGIPKAKWLREDLHPLLLDLFNRRSVEQNGMFSYSYIHRLIHEHVNRICDHQKELWTLLMFELWRRQSNEN